MNMMETNVNAIINTLWLPKEKKWVNPNLFQLMTPESIQASIPWEFLNNQNFQDVYGKLTKLSLEDPVANTVWDYILFKDSSIFRPAALAFEKSEQESRKTRLKPAYTPYIKGTSAYNKFWKEELKRILYGYEPIVDGVPCGIRIPGEFYFYLNYSRIQNIKTDENGKVSDKLEFPDFLAMDYYYFKELEARENPGMVGLPLDYKGNMIVAKSRRKGFSFKGAAGAVWKTAFPSVDKARVLIASQDGHDAALFFGKCMVIIDFLSDYTPFGREEIGDVKTNGGWKYLPVSYTDDSGSFTFGIENTRTRKRDGRLSSIDTVALTRTNKIAGEGIQRVYFEEAGKTENLKTIWTIAKESLKAGSMRRGIAIIFGTGGEMLAGNGTRGYSADFADLFNAPETQDLACYKNIYEYESTAANKPCGYFVSDMWANFGATLRLDGREYQALDKNGNAFFWVAELCLNRERTNAKHGRKEDYDNFLTQRCKTPSEAFTIPTGSVFPVADLLARDQAIKMSRLGYDGLRSKGDLIEVNGRVEFRIDFDNKKQPLDTYALSDRVNREGCVLQYEPPIKIEGKIQEGSYIISVDPIGQNTVAGKSLTSIIVMRTPKYYHITGPEKIVMTYVGRNENNPQGHVHELLVKMAKYYNAKITYENDRDGGILHYFQTRGLLHMLLSKPEMTISKYIPNSKTSLREFGHSMATQRHKMIGENLLLEWLMKRHSGKKVLDEDTGEIVKLEGKRNLDMLEDRGIIEELINYRRDGNFDRVMALMGCVIQCNELFNDDRVIQDTLHQGSISDFLVDLYVNKYGSPIDKMKRQEIKHKRIEKSTDYKLQWEDDDSV